MPDTKASRASLTKVNLSFGMLTVSVDLVPAQHSKKSKEQSKVVVSNICPVCTVPTRLAQKLYCSAVHDHGPYKPNEADKAVEVNGELVRTSDEEAATVKQPDVESRQVALSVVPAEQIDSVSLPSGNIYRVRLKKTDEINRRNYALLRSLVRGRPEVAFIGEAVIKGVVKLYRLIVWQGDVVLTEMVRPSEFYLPEDNGVDEGEQRHVQMGNALIDAMLEDFDPQAWSDRAAQRLAVLQTSMESGGDEAAEPETDAAVSDLLALLEQSVANAA